MAGLQERYTDEQRAKFFALYDASRDPVSGVCSLRSAAAAAGIKISTARTWVDKRPEVRERLEESGVLGATKEKLADMLDDLALYTLESIRAKIPDAKLGEAMAAFGIMVDKSRLLRGMPGSISEHIVTDAEAIAAMRKLGIPIRNEEEPTEVERIEARFSP